MTKKALLLIFCFYLLSPLIAQDTELVLKMAFPVPDSTKTDDYLMHPYDLATFKGKYFVIDTLESRAKVFSSKGILLKTIGSEGSGPAELSKPYVITIDNDKGILYIAGQSNRRISCFTVDGEYNKIIKASLSVIDIEYLDKHIYTASYNEANQTLFARYDNSGRIQNLFGEFFDPKVNKMSQRYRMVLYQEVCLGVNNGSLYVFFDRLPLIKIYDNSGNLKQTINVKIKEIQSLYNDNINAARSTKKRQGGRMGLKKWLFGAYAEGDFLYCYSPYQFGCILVINHAGELKQKIYFKEKPDNGWLIRQKFIKKEGKDYIFVDLENGQVKIYQEN